MLRTDAKGKIEVCLGRIDGVCGNRYYVLLAYDDGNLRAIATKAGTLKIWKTKAQAIEYATRNSLRYRGGKGVEVFGGFMIE